MVLKYIEIIQVSYLFIDRHKKELFIVGEYLSQVIWRSNIYFLGILL